MKKLLYFTAFTLLLLNSCEPTDCARFKNGTFRITDHGRVDIIERNGAVQKEYWNGAKEPTVYTVKWVDECTYTLTPSADVFRKYPKMPKNAMMTVKINRTTPDSYFETSILNFTDKTVTAEVVKIK